MSRGIVLLSGGLDSVVSLALAKESYNIGLALTFDYGQKSAKNEIEASKKISDYYSINHKVIKLEWLKNITHNALTENIELPNGISETSDSVWVPNRNGLFLNIAACFADGEGYDYIIIGANKEEGETFSDNTAEFIKRINSEFEYSVSRDVQAVAPLINFNKNDIVKLALNNNVPLDLVYSCYASGNKHCGKCESCTRLKNALIANDDEYYIGKLF